jgi:predicted Zn-dependent protease
MADADSELGRAVGLNRFARGLGAARAGDVARARVETGALDSIARHLQQSGDTAEARDAFAAALRNNPGRARTLFGLARASELAGDSAGAKQAYAEYLALMVKGDQTRPELAVARRSLALH